MRKTFGIGYQGSKSRIAQDIINILPSGQRFVDLFAGGCAMTHCAMVSGKYKEVLSNDLYPCGVKMFKDAIEGKYKDEKRWVSRDDFFNHKDDDTEFGRYARLCFSFGNNQSGYLYSREIEPYKKAYHFAVVYDDWSLLKECVDEGQYNSLVEALNGVDDVKTRRLRFMGIAKHLGRKYQELQGLESLQRLQGLENEKDDCLLTISQSSYDEYEWREGDVVYCDPPYEGTGKYNKRDFNHQQFYEWVRTRDYPIYFSEYNAPSDFVCLWEKKVMKNMCGGKGQNGSRATEKVYIHEKWGSENF